MKLRIEFGEIHLSRAVKLLGGRWNKSKKYWQLPYGNVLRPGLERRIIDDKNENS